MRVLQYVWVSMLWCVSLSSSNAAQHVVLHGSNTIGEKLAPNLVQRWLRERGCSEITQTVAAVDHLRVEARCDTEVTRADILAFGTGTGFAELQAGRADLWMASRPVSAAEVEKAGALLPLQDSRLEHVIALDGLSVVVHPANTLASLSMVQLRGIFSGTIRNWRELGGPDAAIRLHARDDRSGTWDSFRSMVLGAEGLSGAARRYESSEALSRAVAADPAAIGFVGLAAVGSCRALPISDGGSVALAPVRPQITTEDYPLARRLYLYSRPDASGLTQELLQFVLSEAGQSVVEHTGFVGLEVRPLDRAQPAAGAARHADYLEVTAGARRLGLNFRFSERTAALDSRAERDVERLLAFMRRPENAGRRLRLAGFSDSRELAFGALLLSMDRADYVAMLLNRGGVAVSRVRGLGQALPVADNASESGRQRNRRVEVWLEEAGPDLGSRSAAAATGTDS